MKSKAYAMTSYLSRLNPVPGFPEYTGPYKVGSIDVELPISELDSPSPSPDESISTVQYQIFYPCEPDAKGKGLSWIPTPQREYVSAYARFVGAGSKLAEFIS
jgi:platelet-activating factor acetylhydrolase